MSIIREERRTRFTIIDSETLEDERLSYRARGLLGYLLSKPDNWQTNREQLALGSPTEAVRAIRTALTELQAFGYLERKRYREASTGRWKWDVIVHEVPVEKPQLRAIGRLPTSGTSGRSSTDGTVGSPSTTGVDVGKQDKPAGGTIGRSTIGGQRAVVVKTEVTSKPITKTPTSPSGDKKAMKDDPLRGFDKFWELYPRRDGKRLYRGKAEQQWKRLKLEDRYAAYRGAGHYGTACEQGLNRAADAFRWLRDRCWEDWQTPATADVKREKRDGQVQSWSPASAPTGRQFGGSLA